MFLRKPTMKSIGSYSDNITELRAKIETADAIIIGAGAGLSTSAGLAYDGERFSQYFSDFEEEYGFHDMYAGGFYPYRTFEEHWAYWSRYIAINRYANAPKPVYNDLYRLVKGKDYFVITTNVDHCFQKAGFDKKRLFYTQGDYGLFQCSVPCHNKTYDNESIVKEMLLRQKGRHIPAELLPKCPVCGKLMTMNLRSDNKFVQDEGWYLASERYSNFLRTRKKNNILYFEIGVGYNTPAIIKYPFWQMTAENKKATYVCINKGEALCPKEIEGQSICLNGDIGEILEKIKWNYGFDFKEFSLLKIKKTMFQ